MHDVYLFDIDGTLLSSAGAGKAALEEALAEAFNIQGVMERVALSGRTDRAIVADLFRFAGLENSEENRERLLSAYLHFLPGHLARGKGKVLPGVVELLTQLSARSSAVVGLLTGNHRAGADVKLGHFGLMDWFSCGGYGDHHEDRDDVARSALEAVETYLGSAVQPDRIWVIGDTPFDVRCARAIGARALAVVTGWHSHEELAACQPDALLMDLSAAGSLFR